MRPLNGYTWSVYLFHAPTNTHGKIRTDRAQTIDGAKRFVEWYLKHEVSMLSHLCIAEIVSPTYATYVRIVNSKGTVTWCRK